MAKSTKNTYTENSIKELSNIEGIRQEYGMYIGVNGPDGVKRLFYEGIGNAIDEYNGGRCNNISVTINDEDHSITIADDGIGIFQNKIEVICTKIHAGGKFDGEYSQFSIGQHGVGLTVINALSESLKVQVKRDGAVWQQTFSKGIPVSKVKRIKDLPKGASTGTIIKFYPDIEIMEDISMNIEEYLEFVKFSAYLNKGLRFKFKGIKADGTIIEETLYSKKGMIDYITTLDNKLLLKNSLYNRKEDTVTKELSNGKEKSADLVAEVIMNFSKNDTNVIKTYCNGIENIDGGTHRAGFLMAMTEFFSKAIENSTVIKKEDKIPITSEDIQEGLVALIVTYHTDAVYKSQTKDQLTSTDMRMFVKTATMAVLKEWAKDKPNEAKAVYARILLAAKARTAANRAKVAKKKAEAGSLTGFSSLSKITLATGDKNVKKRMFIVEGDSAGGSAVSARCPLTDGIAKLRGKPLNTRGVSSARLDANKEFSDITISLECGVDDHFDIEKLAYDQIILMADSDVDGNHIISLLLLFFWEHMRELVLSGKIYIAKAPLYKIIENGKNIFLNNKYEYNAYIANRILDLYSIGCISGKKVKNFTKKDLVKFLDTVKFYSHAIQSLSNDLAVDVELIEYLVYNIDLVLDEPSSLPFKELKMEKIKDSKAKYRIIGMLNDNYQALVLSKKLISRLKELYNILEEQNYTNLCYKKADGKYIKIKTGALYNMLIKYGTPPHRQRFKGLGEMDYDELWVTTMDPKSNGITQLIVNDEKDVHKAIATFFDTDTTNRKDFLDNFKIDPDDIDN